MSGNDPSLCDVMMTSKAAEHFFFFSFCYQLSCCMARNDSHSVQNCLGV